jgi:hypothetical protein
MILYPNDRLMPVIFGVGVAICSKVIFRAPVGDGKTQHIFNPSNLGIVATLLLFPSIGVAPPYHFTENFTLYMIPDPATTPVKPPRQALFALAIAAVYGVLQVEHVVYGLFIALAIVCAMRSVGLYAQAAWQSIRAKQRGLLIDERWRFTRRCAP